MARSAPSAGTSPSLVTRLVDRLPPPPSSPTTRARVRTAFRVLAVVEALTWAGLLAGMAWHYLLENGRGGIEAFGPLHGAAFVAYGTVALLTWWVQRWRPVVGLLSLAAAVPPFGTVVFELWAQRRGHLDDRAPA